MRHETTKLELLGWGIQPRGPFWVSHCLGFPTIPCFSLLGIPSTPVRLTPLPASPPPEASGPNPSSALNLQI